MVTQPVSPHRPDPLAHIARDIIVLGLGGRLPTTLEYQRTIAVGSGTVQKALRELQDCGAVNLRARGHRGTFIESMDVAALWQRTGLRPLHLLLPPRGPDESIAVAAGFHLACTELGADTTIGFRRGAADRLAALDGGEADVVLVSSGAAAHLLGEDLAATPTRTRRGVGEGTYYRPGSLMVVTRTGAAGPPRRIGIDPSSDDHQRLTLAEFPASGGYDYVETDFTRLPAALLSGAVDAGVWHYLDLTIPLDLIDLSTRPLEQPAATALAEQLSEAILVAQAGSVAGAILGRIDLGVVQGAFTSAVAAGSTQRSELRYRT